MASLTTQTLTKAKGLAPWRPGLPWWIVFIEGGLLVVIGILIVINPSVSSINVAIGLTLLLLMTGIIELWAVFRNRVAPGADATIAARGAIAVYAGASILFMVFMDIDLSLAAGRVLFGLAAVSVGALGLVGYIGGARKRLRGLLVDSLFFLFAGLLVIYAQWRGGVLVAQAMLWLGWISIVAGLGLGGFAFWRRQQSKDGSDDEARAVPTPAAEAGTRLAQAAATVATASESVAQDAAAGVKADTTADAEAGAGAGADVRQSE